MAISNFHPFKKGASGLTLIEVLIALAIVAIALTAALNTTAQNIRNTAYIQEKILAGWVGLEVISEVQADVLKLPEDSREPLTKETKILGRKLSWAAMRQKTANKHIDQIEVLVYGGGDQLLTKLVGYAYKE